MHKRSGPLAPTLFLCTLALTLGACSDADSDATPSVLPQNGAASGSPASDAPGASAQGTQVGTAAAPSTIAPGAEFRADIAGVRIRMPNGITGQFDPASGTLVFGNAQNSLGGFVFGGSLGGVATGAGRALKSLLPALGLQVEDTFEDSVSPEGFPTFRFAAGNDAGQVLYMHLEVRQGAVGNYVAVLGNSTPDAQSELDAIVSQISASAVFEAPPATRPLVNMAGVILESSSSSSTLVGGFGDGSISGGDESVLLTCTDGRYVFRSTSTTVIGFSDFDGSGSSTEAVEHAGVSGSLVDFGDNQLFTMVSQDRGAFVHNVTLSDGTIFLDQTGYRQTGTSEAECGG